MSPAARVGDHTVSADDLLDEVDRWASSPTLLQQLQVASVQGAGEGSYDTGFVDFVLSNRISFELHNEQFDALGLQLSEQELGDVRAGIFPDPATSQAVLSELGRAYGERLVADVARQFAVSQSMGPEYQDWRFEALTTTDIEVSPRYGRWESTSGQVVPPDGPLPAPGAQPFGQP